MQHVNRVINIAHNLLYFLKDAETGHATNTQKFNSKKALKI